MTARISPILVLALLATSACAPQREVGPHAVPVQQPIEPACATDMAPLAATGLLVSTSFAKGTRTRSRITNRGAKNRIVAPQSVSVCVGPCAGLFASCEPRRRWDAGGERAYAVTLAPGETLELEVDAALRGQASSCEKVAVIAVLDVDGSRACADLGGFIAQAGAP